MASMGKAKGASNMGQCLGPLVSHDAKDALIHTLWAQEQALRARVAELEARPNFPTER
jgi:hypothetical protein